MRDHCKQCWASENDLVYKEVVIVGNGPSGLSLSFILSGNWPHYNGLPMSDKMLERRLSCVSKSETLLKQDIPFLAQGIESRSRSVVGGLWDELVRPGADQGLQMDSAIDWLPHDPVDHVVIGGGPPGGAWQRMDKDILTLSLNSWMELPGLRFEEWERSRGRKSEGGERRVKVALVAQYYTDYLKLKRLNRYQRRGRVTSVRPCTKSELGIPEEESMESLWIVEGTYNSRKKFKYITKFVVLATGTSDLPNGLGVPGENAPWVYHTLAQLETALEKLTETNQTKGRILVVGGGLSGADAVLASRFRGLEVVHVFRRSTGFMERILPESMYPEYHKVHEMMRVGESGYPEYTPLAGHRVRKFVPCDSGGGLVEVAGAQGKPSLTFRVDLSAVLIGSRPDLSFIDPTVPLQFEGESGRSVEVNPWTYAVCRAPKGLLAVGPLAGDNFVRFSLGGVAAAASHIIQETRG